MANRRAAVQVFDTTLRDGEQAPGVSLQAEEKIEIPRCLEDLGVDVVEAGFPVTSRGEEAALRALSRELRDAMVAVMARGREADITAAGRRAMKHAVQPRINIISPTSDIHLFQVL